MTHCLIGLGANLGDRATQLEQAIQRICGHPQIQLLRTSAFCETLAIGGPPHQGAFLNAVVRVDTALPPAELLACLQQAEQAVGRQRHQRWGPRVIDADLLLYGTLELRTAQLEVPHPRMAFRRFVLEPANQIAGDMLHPSTGWQLARLLQHLNKAANYIALTGPPGADTQQVAQQSARATDAFVFCDASDYVECRADNEAILHMERESLQRRRLWLDSLSTKLHAGPGCFAISDFWIEQSLAVARAWLQEPARGKLDALVHEALAGVVQPKLRVFLDTPADIAYARLVQSTVGSLPFPQRHSLERIREELAQLVQQKRQGPVLHLVDSDPGLAITELTAAIDAMR